MDADCLVYRFGREAQDLVDLGGGMYTNIADINEAIAMVDGFVADLKKTLDADEVTFCLSDATGYWRRDVYSSYKGNRNAATSRPLLFMPLRSWLLESRDAVLYPLLEGDDVLGILGTTPEEGVTKIICSIDKDMKTLPVPFYDWGKPELGVQMISQVEAERTFLRQTLEGDRTDGYPGCPSIGPVRARRVLQPFEAETDAGLLVARAWPAIVRTFETQGLGEAEAIAMARCARILRAENWDSENQAVHYWQPPGGEA